MTPTRLRQGLTLIELLIIVAIIAILIAVIFPPIHRGRPTFLTACMTNQRQLAMGLLIYSEDNKQAFPNLDDLSGNDGPIALSLITNYVKQTNVFMCPAVMHQREKSRSWFADRFVAALNPAFFRSNGNDYAYYDGLNVTMPSTNALIADRLAWTNRPPNNIHGTGRAVAGFLDGHAEVLRQDRVIGADYQPPWSAQQDPSLRP